MEAVTIKRNWKLFWLFCGILLSIVFGFLFPQNSVGQSPTNNNELRIPDDGEAAPLIEKAERLGRQGDFESAIGLYLKVLKEDDNSVLELEKGRYLGVYHFILQKIRDLPPQGREIFQKLYEEKASLLLKEALKKGPKNTRALQLIGEVYFPTKAGIQANLLIANSHLEEGRAREAFERYFSLLKLTSFPPGVSGSLLISKAILALKGLQTFNQKTSERIHQLYQMSKKAPPLSIGNQQLSLEKYFIRTLEPFFTFQIIHHLNTPLRARIVSRTPKGIYIEYGRGTTFFNHWEILSIKDPQLVLNMGPRKGSFNRSQDFSILGGDSSHQGFSTAFPKMGKILFGPKSITYEGVRKRIPNPNYSPYWQRYGSQYVKGDFVFPFHGAVYKDWLYVAGAKKLLICPLDNPDAAVHKYSTPQGARSQVEEENSEILYSPLVYEDRVYSTFIANPDFITSEKFRSIPIKVRIPLRRLMCFNRFTGQKLWEKDGKEDSFFKGASVPITPVMRDNVLYCTAFRMKGYVQTFVVALDGETGKTLWKKWISSGSLGTTMFGFHAREPLSTMLAESEGILYCCTNQGAIAALRATDGKILWVQKYDTIRIYAPKGIQPKPRRIHWANNPPLVVDDKVCVAPMDSPYFYTLDKYTGKILWKQPRKFSSGSVEYLVGASQGMVILNGREVVAWDLNTGAKKWTSQLYGAKPWGKGLICKDAVVFPVQEAPSEYNNYQRQNKLIVIDLLKGIQRQYIDLPYSIAPGNLIVTDKYIVLVSEDRVTVFKNYK